MMVRRSLIVAALLASLPLVVQAADDSTTATVTPAAIRFRRVLTPAEQVPKLLGDQSKFVPVDAKQFGQWAETWEAAAKPNIQPAPDAVIEGARYEAKLDASDALQGEAAVSIVLRGNAATLLRLDPLGLAITNPQWAGKVLQPALLGTQAAGPPLLQTEKSGQLKFGWSLSPQRDATGALIYPFALPASPVNHLMLDLPLDCTPGVEGALLSSSEGAVKGWRRWDISLGGANRFNLRIVKEVAGVQRRHLTLVRQSLTYDISPRGLEVSAQLKLEAVGAPIRKVNVAVGAPLTFLSARHGDTNLPWSQNGDHSGNASHIVIDLPDPIETTGRIRLSAVCPLPADISRDHRWRLPSIRAADVFWQEGTATLLVSEPLSLDQFNLTRCRQTRTGPLPAPLTGEVFEVQYYADDAEIEVGLDERRDRVQLAGGTAIELSGSGTTGRAVLDITAQQGERFNLEANVNPEWIIDSVQSVPADALAEWTQNSPDMPAGRLSIRLAKPLKPKRPLRLIVTGRRRRIPLQESLRTDDLQLLTFEDISISRLLVALHPAGPYQLQLENAEELARLDPRRLEASDRSLFGDAPAGVIFKIDPSAAELRVSLAEQTPHYSGEIQVQASVSKDALTESYAIACQPESNLYRMRVHLSQSRPEALAWTLPSEAADALASRRLTDIEQAAAGLGADGETWEITFRQPRGAPFAITGARTSAWSEDTPLSLAYLTEATTQRATVVVRSTSDVVPRIVNRRLKSIWAETPTAGRYATALAAYLYEPGRDALATSDFPLRMAPGDSQSGLSDIWAWRCQLTTRAATQGRVEHTATYWIENSGRAGVQLHLQAGEQLQYVSLDDVHAPVQAAAGDPTALSIALPPGRRFVTLSVQYLGAENSLGTVSRVAPSPPIVDFSVLARQWTLWLPPGYEVLPGTRQGQASRVPAMSWSQRLFGPLGRNPDDPGSLAIGGGTVPGLASQSAGAAAAADKARSLIYALGSQREPAGSDKTNAGGTWPALLSTAWAQTKNPAGSDVALLIDTWALARAGIGPDTSVTLPVADTSRDRGLALLEQSNLVLVVHPRAIVLTTRVVAAQERSLQPGSAILGPCIVVGPLQEQVWQSLSGVRPARLLPLDQWMAIPRAAEDPWTDNAVAADALADNDGWTACHLELGAGDTAPVWIVHNPTRMALAWSLLLFTAGLSYWKGPRSFRSLAVTFAVVAILALAVPQSIAPFFSSVLLGLAAAQVLRALRSLAPARLPIPAADSVSSKSRALLTSGASVLVVILTFTALRALAADAVPNEPSRQPVMYDVLVPVDSDLKPVGAYVYVPEALYLALAPRVAETEPARRWLLQSAVYRGSIATDAMSKPVAADVLATFDLTTLDDDAHVMLPLGGDGASLVPGSVKLDGQAAAIEAVSGQRGVRVSVPRHGSHVLEAAVRCVVSSSGTGVELAVPPTPNARLELNFPNKLTVEVLGIRGAANGGTAGRLTAELGAIDRLRLHWSGAVGAAVAQPVVDADEMFWLKVQPGAVMVEARWRVKAAEGRISQVRVATDSRLQLLPPRDSNAATAHATTIAGDPQVVQFDLVKPSEAPDVIEASFLLTGASGIGQMHFPRLEVQGMRTNKRWVAVSIDPSLDGQPVSSLKTATAGEFATAWGAGDVKPQFVYQLPSGNIDWSLACRPRDPHLTAREKLTLSLESQRIRVGFSAMLSSSGGSRFQYRVVTPIPFTVDQVSVREGAAEKALRWSRDSTGQITIFLTGAAGDEQRLLISGTLPMQKSLKLPLPRIEGCEVASANVLVFRRPEVAVTVTDLEGLKDASPDEALRLVAETVDEGLIDAPAALRGRLARCLSGAKGAALNGTLTTSANHPVIEAVQSIALLRQGEQWDAVLNDGLEVRQGTVDALYFNVPPNWRGPFEVTPAADVELVEVPGEAFRQLIVRPRAPIGDHFQLTIRGPLALAAGERVRVPEIVPTRVKSLKNYIALPNRLGQQQVAWDTRNLNPIPPPEGLSLPMSDREAFTIYQVMNSPFRAQLQSVEHKTGEAQVLLADISLAWRQDRSCFGTAAFDLEPAGLTSCLLELPPSYRLVHATVAGLPAILTSSGEHRWTVMLGPDQLPQRIELVFAGQLAEESARSGNPNLEAPSLVGLAPERTLWTLMPPAGMDATLTDQNQPADPINQEVYRLDAAAALIDTGSAVAAEQSSDEAARWYRPWASRLLATRAAVQRTRARTAASEISQDAASKLSLIESEQARIAKRLGTSSVLTELGNRLAPFEGPAELWQWSLDCDRWPLLCMVRGPSPALTTHTAVRSASSSSGRWWAIAIVVLLTTVAVVLSRKAWFDRRAQSWLPLGGIAVGLLWFWALNPAWIGIAIAAVSLIVILQRVRAWLLTLSTVHRMDESAVG